MIKRIRITRRSFRHDSIFGWKLFEWIRDRFERTISDLTLWMKPSTKCRDPN
jgi:hypothetical protein